MPRLRINRNGIALAQAGHLVSDNDRYMLLSPNAASMQIFMSGVATYNVTGIDTGAPSPYNNRYKRVTVNFGKAFAKPPVVIFQNYTTGQDYDYLPNRASIGVQLISGQPRARFEPNFVDVTTTSATFWAVTISVNRVCYLILENGLE